MYSNVERTRWLRVAVGTVMMLCLGTLYAWSIFRAPFGALYPSWTTADLSMNFTISMVCYSAGGFLGGKLSKKTSNTVTALAAAVLIFAGFLGVSWLSADPETAKVQLYLFYGVLSGLGTGFGYNTIVSGVGGWFPDKNGLATGVLLTGFGLGTMLIGQLADALIPVVGLPTLFRAFAVVIAVVLALGSPMVRLPRAGTVLPPPPATAQVEEQRDPLRGAGGQVRPPEGDAAGQRLSAAQRGAAGAGRHGPQRGAGTGGHAHHGSVLWQLRHHRYPGHPAVLRLGPLCHQPGHRQLLRHPRVLHRAADRQRASDRLGG